MTVRRSDQAIQAPWGTSPVYVCYAGADGEAGPFVVASATNPLPVKIISGADGGTDRMGAVAQAGDWSVKKVETIQRIVQTVNTNACVGGYTLDPDTLTGIASQIQAVFDEIGRQITAQSIRKQKGNQKTTITSSVTETTIITLDKAFFLDLYGLILTNTSSTPSTVTIKDATAGTTRYIFDVPTRQTVGFLGTESSAHKQDLINNNWTATCGTSIASMEITALFIKNSKK